MCERFAFMYVCTAHEYLVPTELAEGVRPSDNVSRYVGAENQIRKSSDGWAISSAPITWFLYLFHIPVHLGLGKRFLGAKGLQVEKL